MFGKKRKFRKVADRIGEVVHLQILQSFEKKEGILGSSNEMVFVSGYLQTFVYVGLSDIGCRDLSVHSKYIKHICNGVLPNRLWDIYQRGEALSELSQSGERQEFIEARKVYELSKDAGISDAHEFFYNGTPPKNLANYLIGQPVHGPGMK